jgi:hypothetical protein
MYKIHEVLINFIEMSFEGDSWIMKRLNVNHCVVNKGLEGLLLPWTC